MISHKAQTISTDFEKRFGIQLKTLRGYINGDGSPQTHRMTRHGHSTDPPAHSTLYPGSDRNLAHLATRP